MNKTMNEYIRQYRLKENANYFYVYLHRRKSDNSIFYVGKGCGSRAWNNKNRNKYWHNITDKNEYVVDICLDNLSESDALNFEIDTIKELEYFGYKLANFTSGGDTPIFNKESRDRMSKARKGKSLSQQHKRSLSLAATGRKRPDLVGSNNCKFDSNLYCFINVNSLEIIRCTRMHLAGKLNISPLTVRCLFSSRPSKTVKGWALFNLCSDIDFRVKELTSMSTVSSKEVVNFIHESGQEFIGSRKDLAIQHNIKLDLIHALFCKNPRPHVKGWRVKDTNDTTNQPKG